MWILGCEHLSIHIKRALQVMDFMMRRIAAPLLLYAYVVLDPLGAMAS